MGHELNFETREWRGRRRGKRRDQGDAEEGSVGGSHRKRQGQPCVNCQQIMGVTEGAVTAAGFKGQSHELCIRTRAMPYLSREMIGLLQECELQYAEATGNTLDQAHAYRHFLASGRLRTMGVIDFGELLSRYASRILAVGKRDLQTRTQDFLKRASGRLFIKVTAKSGD